MSRMTLSPKRGVAGLTAAVVTVGTLGVLAVGSSTAAGPVITVASATVANPLPTKDKPTIPAAGAFDGSGTAVSIVGTNFPATPTVAFGDTEAVSAIRLSDKLIVAKAPALDSDSTADVPVTITVGDGTGAEDPSEDVTSTANLFTYKAAPDLTGAKYSADGKNLEIAGVNLDDSTQLQLGPLTVKLKAEQSTKDKITLKVPSGLVKAKYAITVTTLWGTDTLTPDWSVVPAPKSMIAATSTAKVGSADSVAPNTIVRITGTSLSGVDSVSFGYAAAEFLVSSDTELYVVVPAMSATQTSNVATPNKGQVVKVPVEVKNGGLKVAKPLTFEYKVKAIVTDIDKTEAATGTTVTVTGKNLKTTKLYFGAERNAKSVSHTSDSTETSAKFVMPKAAATGFELGKAYQVWLVSKGGNLSTGRSLTVTK